MNRFLSCSKVLISFSRRKFALRYRWILLLGVIFVVVNLQVFTQNETTMPPRSVAYGYFGSIEPALKSRSTGAPRVLSGEYTADRLGAEHAYPLDPIILKSLAQGEIPFWNPYVLTGMPLLAEYWWGMFYPPNLMKILIPESWWDMYSAFHVLLLAISIYLLARIAYRGTRNALFAGSALFGSGFILLYFPLQELITGIPWGAMLFLAVELLVKKRWDLVGLTFVAAGVYGLGSAGHPAISIFWVVTFVVYLLARWILDRNTSKSLVPLVTMATLAAFATAPNVVPFADYVLGVESSSLAIYDQPHFYSFRDFLLFLFPYVFGPVDQAQPSALLSGNAPGFLLLVPFMLYPAFAGGWRAIKRRNVQMVAMMISAVVMSMWGFGIPPISQLSLLPLMKRLTFSYIWIMPTVTLCVLAGYGFQSITRESLVQIRRMTRVYVALYLFMVLTLVIFVWKFGLLADFLGDEKLLQRGLLPDVAFAIMGPLIVLMLAAKVESRSGFHARFNFASAALFLGLGLNIAAAYPNAHPLGGIRIPLAAFVVFVVASILFAALNVRRKSQFFKYATRPSVALIIVAAFVTVANLKYPGLPERYDIVSTPKFVDMLSQDRLNWRVYGMNGAVPMNNLSRFEISAVNNLSALAPKPLDTFVHNYLDSNSSTTQFYGLAHSEEYWKNIRYWEYIGVRHIATGSMAGMQQESEEQIFYDALHFERRGTGQTILVDLPKSAGGDLHFGLLRQMDCSDGAFSEVRMRLGTYGRFNTGKVVLTVTDPINDVALARAAIDASRLIDPYFQSFSLGRVVCENPSLKVNVRVYYEDDSPDSKIAAWRTGNRSVDVLRVFIQPILSASRFRLTGRDNETGISIVEDPLASPRAYFTNHFSVSPDWRTAQAEFAKQDDLHAVAFGEDANSICQSSTSKVDDYQIRKSVADVKITELRSSSVSIMAKIPTAGTLVLVDTFMPGWTAIVDGKPKPVQRVNGLFRGVCLDSPGTHNVTMNYRPPYWADCVYLAAMGIIGVAMILVYGFFNRSKKMM